ncbi:MAG: hypothetical protein NWE76_05895 [Candidatus Bathyarchaeota archaeon]|nr:hypothetical protein [Candidatus Bathyarchaeota archaeon]
MAARLANKRIITVLLALLVLVPTSLSYAQNQEGKDKQVEKFIELAERAKEKTEILINMTYLNTTALGMIESDLREQLDDNVTLFDEAAYNITIEEYQNVGNLTLALGVFRDVYKAINRILAATPEVQRGQLVDAQGLLQAMTRALDRIERLGDIGELPDEAIEAMGYLNITHAILWLQDGRVEDVTENLTTANRLISEAHKALKNAAAEMNTNRMRNYIKIMNNFHRRLTKQVETLGNETLEGWLGDAADLISGGQGAEELMGQGEYEEALGKLEDARTVLEEVEQGLKAQRKAEKGNGKD